MTRRLMLVGVALGLFVVLALCAAPFLRAQEKAAPKVPAKSEYRLAGVVAGLSPVEVATLPLRLNQELWSRAIERPEIKGLACFDYVQEHYAGLLRVKSLEAPGTVVFEMKRVSEIPDRDAMMIGDIFVNLYLERVQFDRENRAREERSVLVQERERIGDELNKLRNDVLAAGVLPELPRMTMTEALEKARLGLMQAKARHEALAAGAEEAKKIAVSKPVPALAAAMLNQAAAMPKDDAEVAALAQAVAVAVARAQLDVLTGEALVRQLEPEAEKERIKAQELGLKRRQNGEKEEELKGRQAQYADIDQRLRELRLKHMIPGPEYRVLTAE